MKPTFFKKTIAITGSALVLTIYMGAWLCAIVFYDKAALGLQNATNVSYGYAIIKALLLAKFMLISRSLSGKVLGDISSLYWLIIIRTSFGAVVVLVLGYLFAGVQGIFYNEKFMDAMAKFCGGSFTHALSLLILYWLIALPLVAYTVLKEVLGADKFHLFLSGNSNQ